MSKPFLLPVKRMQTITGIDKANNQRYFLLKNARTKMNKRANEKPIATEFSFPKYDPNLSLKFKVKIWCLYTIMK